jgi:hypothetical protein
MPGLPVATITATYVPLNAVGRRVPAKQAVKFRVLIRPASAPRMSRMVGTQREAIELVHHFNPLGMGVSISDRRYRNARWSSSISVSSGRSRTRWRPI